MNRLFFDLGVLLFWSDASLESKRLVSKGTVIVSDNSAMKSIKDGSMVVDPDVVAMLRSLNKAGYALYLCDNMPPEKLRDCLTKLDLNEYFEAVVYAKDAEEVTASIQKIREKDDFLIFVGSNPNAIKGALMNQVPCIAYGENMHLVEYQCFSSAYSPLEIEDQVDVLYVVHSVARRAIEKNSRVMGIDGIAFAGKKELAEKLLRYFDFLGKEAQVVDLEDFHRAVEETYKGEDPVEAYYFNGYNNEKLIDEVLNPFTKNGSIDKKVFCLDSSNEAFINERHYKISEDGTMILLGSMMYRDPLLQYFDTTIYMRVDYREAEHRASLEDTPIYGDDPLEIYRAKFIPAQKMYVSRHDPFEKRDFVIDNSNFHRPFFIT